MIIKTEKFNNLEGFEIQFNKIKNKFFYGNFEIPFKCNKKLPDRVVFLRGKDIRTGLWYNITEGSKKDMIIYIKDNNYCEYYLAYKQN